MTMTTTMAISLNHTIIPARDRHVSATFLTEILGLPPHATIDPFAVVQVDETTLDFMDTDGEIASLHYAFLVSDAEFDAIFRRNTTLSSPVLQTSRMRASSS